jgi:hypothetical protein
MLFGLKVFSRECCTATDLHKCQVLASCLYVIYLLVSLFKCCQKDTIFVEVVGVANEGERHEGDTLRPPGLQKLPGTPENTLEVTLIRSHRRLR